MVNLYSRRSFVGRIGQFCGAGLLLACVPQVRAARPGRIGFLSGAMPGLFKAFEDELGRLGYVAGENLVIEKRIARPNTSDTGRARRRARAHGS